MSLREGYCPERSGIESKIERIGTAALEKALETHDSLGESGLEEINVNPMGEITLKGDIEIEKAALHILGNSHLPVVVHSEEHGIVKFGESPKFLVVLDGIDGSRSYRTEFGYGRYATMLGIFTTNDPKYSDYIFLGIMEHATRRFIYAVKGKGSFLRVDGQISPIRTSGVTLLDSQTAKLCADTNFDRVFKTTIVGNIVDKLRGFDVVCLASSAAHYASLATGEVDAVIESTRGGNLEIATAYGLVREAGGVMVTLDGKDIGDKNYLKFGQKDHLLVISASTLQLAQALTQRLRI